MFVPPAQPHRRAGIGTCDELLRLAIGEGAALQLKAALGGGGEPVPIAGLGGAEKALGRDMQPDGLADGRREMARQPLGAGDFVPVVGPALQMVARDRKSTRLNS